MMTLTGTHAFVHKARRLKHFTVGRWEGAAFVEVWCERRIAYGVLDGGAEVSWPILDADCTECCFHAGLRDAEGLPYEWTTGERVNFPDLWTD